MKNQFAPLSQEYYPRPFSLDELALRFQHENRQQFPLLTPPAVCDNPYAYATPVGIYQALFYTKKEAFEQTHEKIRAKILYMCEIQQLNLFLQAQVEFTQQIHQVVPKKIKIFDWNRRIASQQKNSTFTTPSYEIDPYKKIESIHRIDTNPLWFICQQKE
jgi:hypothetical protein